MNKARDTRLERTVAKSDIWLLGLTRDVQTRFTFEPGDNVFPIWSQMGLK